MADVGADRQRGGRPGRDAHIIIEPAVQVAGRQQANPGLAAPAQQRVAPFVLERDRGVGEAPAAGVHAQLLVDRVVVPYQADFELRVRIDVPGGLVGGPARTRLVAVGVLGERHRIGLARVLFDLGHGQGAGLLVVGLAVAEIEARLQAGTELVAEVGDHAARLAVRLRLEPGAGLGGGRDEIIPVADHLARAHETLAVAVAAALHAGLERGRVVAGARDVVDRAAQHQGASVEGIGTAQDLGARQAERLEQLIGRAARAAQGKAVEQKQGAGTEEVGTAVDGRTADRNLDAVGAAGRLGIDAGLEGQHVLVGEYASLLHLGGVDHAHAARHFLQARLGAVKAAQCLALDVDRGHRRRGRVVVRAVRHRLARHGRRAGQAHRGRGRGDGGHGGDRPQ
jgi:hypothetical protein